MTEPQHPADLLRSIGREMERQTEHLRMIRQLTGIVCLVAVAAAVLVVLVLIGAITVEFKPTSP